jgi:hypothetical protein
MNRQEERDRERLTIIQIDRQLDKWTDRKRDRYGQADS